MVDHQGRKTGADNPGRKRRREAGGPPFRGTGGGSNGAKKFPEAANV